MTIKNLLDSPNFKTNVAMALLEAGADVETKSTAGETLLHRLVTYNTPIQEHNLRAISSLVKNYHANIHSKNAEDKTPLECLISQKNWSTQDALLLVSLAEPDTMGVSKGVRDASGQPLIHCLVNYDANGIQLHNRKAIATLVNDYNFDINAVDNKGHTALECLINKRPWDIQDALLLASLGSRADTKDSYGQPLIHCFINNKNNAFTSDDSEAITALVNKYNFDINAVDKDGNTALQRLINKKRWYTKDALLLASLGASPDTKDDDGQPLIHQFVTADTYYGEGIKPSNQAALVDLVEKYSFDINATNNQGHTALQCLMNQPHGFRAEDAMLLVRLGANPNEKSASGESLLHFLAKSSSDNSAAIKKLLTEYSVDISYKNKSESTALEVGFEAITHGKGNSANANILMNYSNDFEEQITNLVKTGKKVFPHLNKLIFSAHVANGSKSYELQGKIRGTAFEAFKESLLELSLDEKLDKLYWALRQPIFCMHRSHFFFAKLGQTNTITCINKMISEVTAQQNLESEQEQSETPMSAVY